MERNSRIYPTSIPPNSPDLNPVDVCMPMHVGNVATEGVQNTHHCSGAINDATDEWLPQ